MRISVDKSDRGYHEAAVRCEAFLDGVMLKLCVTADEEEGIAICYVADENGKLKIVDGEFELEERRGKVEVRIPDNVKELFQ